MSRYRDDFYAGDLTESFNLADDAEGLSIGAGEVESAHRYVIQKRLKIAGAWWSIEHARSMLSFRVMRANNHWNQYWKNVA